MALGTPASAGLAGAAPDHQVFLQQFTLLADDAYATGGTLLTKHLRRYTTDDAFDMRQVVHAEGWGVLASVLYLAKYDAANDKLLMFLASTGAEVANATDLSDMTLNLTVWAK